MCRLLLAIDAAKAAGVVVFHEGKLVAHAPADGSTWAGLVRVIRPMVEPYQHVPQLERVVVIESGWIGKRGMKGALTLERRRGLAQAAAEACGFHAVEFVAPPTWHSAVFGSRQSDIKQASIARCKQVYGIEPATDDVADASHIGGYWLAAHRP